MDYTKFMKSISGVDADEAGSVGRAAFHGVGRGYGAPGLRPVLRDRAGLRLSRCRFVQTLADAFEEERPGDGGVTQDLGVTPAIF